MSTEETEQLAACKAQVLAAYEALCATRRNTKAHRLAAALLEERWERLFEVVIMIDWDR